MAERNSDLLRVQEYLTVKEAAEYIGVSTSTLRNWDRSGKLKAFRNPVNGYRLYDQKDLYRVLEEISNGRA
jgi:excisionase family DNA binding protein